MIDDIKEKVTFKKLERLYPEANANDYALPPPPVAAYSLCNPDAYKSTMIPQNSQAQDDILAMLI